MAKVRMTEKERWIWYQILNPMGHSSKLERRRVDKLWEDLELDRIAEICEQVGPGQPVDHRLFEAVDAKEYDLTSDQRDYLIELLEKPGITTFAGRVLKRVEYDMIKGRDGEQAARS